MFHMTPVDGTAWSLVELVRLSVAIAVEGEKVDPAPLPSRHCPRARSFRDVVFHQWECLVIEDPGTNRYLLAAQRHLQPLGRRGELRREAA